MARSYDVAVAALAVDVPIKWIDNLLSRHIVTGVEQASQGTTRRLSPGAVLRIAVVRLLVDALSIPVPRAVQIAEHVCASPRHSAHLEDGAGTIAIDIPRLERQLAGRLADAVESVPRRARGRPPASRSRNVED